MTLKKQLNEAIKALKAEMKMKKMEEAVRHAEEKERISREYAEQLEALINCVTEAEKKREGGGRKREKSFHFLG